MSFEVKTPSNNGGQEQSIEKLDEIFQSVKAQINQWGKDAKWKIDLVLLDNTQDNHEAKVSLPITTTIQYPWDYVAPKRNEYRDDNTDELHHKLRLSLERQNYLENIIKSQAEQIQKMPTDDATESAINTMKNIFLLSQNEQKLHYFAERDLLLKDIDILSRKLKKCTAILEKIESMNISEENGDRDTLFNDRKILSKKLYLTELRLSARNTEIDYLNEVIDTLKSNQDSQVNNTSPRPQYNKKLKKGPPYLFQQQFSPRSEIRSSEQYPLSALDSLGIVADQMLSDPEFEHATNSDKSMIEKRMRSRLDDRRSQRSMDHATTLLTMPQSSYYSRSMQEEPKSSASPSPEPYSSSRSSAFDHIPKKPRSTYTRWTESEDRLLRKAVKKYGHSNWEACAKEISGRSNIQCRNRWIRHLEHRPFLSNDDGDDSDTKTQLYPKLNNSNARHSPSIAALLNTAEDEDRYRHSPTAPPRQLYQEQTPFNRQSYLLPTYRPPSPISTPTHGKHNTDTRF